MVPGALEAMTVDCNLDTRPVKEGSRKSAREAQTPEEKTSKRKRRKNKQTKQRKRKMGLVKIQNRRMIKTVLQEETL